MALPHAERAEGSAIPVSSLRQWAARAVELKLGYYPSDGLCGTAFEIEECFRIFATSGRRGLAACERETMQLETTNRAASSLL